MSGPVPFLSVPRAGVISRFPVCVLALAFLASLSLGDARAGQAQVRPPDCMAQAVVCSARTAGDFALIEAGVPARILVDPAADSAVHRVATSLAGDLERVSGLRPEVLADPKASGGPVVVIGVLGDSPMIDGLVAAGRLDLAGIEGAWEAHTLAVVDAPWPGVPRALVIAGSDRRGAVYGAYELSRRIGVSPWTWFADVPVARQADVHVTAGTRSDRPGVRYRGFFINDENPAFNDWAHERFGGINSALYEPIFELLLRLKGNYLWPAMWAPKAFHLDDPRNAALAHEMGVVMGTSHHEPLTRAQAEWHRLDEPFAGGAWDYPSNGENLRAFWRAGLERLAAGAGGAGYDNLLTVGMRGDGDEAMTEGTAIELLETVVADQRALIAEATGRPAEASPQVWALYKEVQDYYDQGMTVPDDVTLLFADDNWGQVRRLPTKDLGRAGGFGVYYHFDYVGAPRSYKWTNTNQLGKVWQQMNLAWERGARNVWIVNVGDIKPMETPLSLFMDMAWAPEAMGPEALADWPRDWAAQQFGPELAADIGRLLSGYSRLSARRKPELLDAETWATGAIRPDALVRGEWSAALAPWRALVADLDAVEPRVPPSYGDAFYQLVAFPIRSMANLYEMHFATAWNHALAARFDPRGNAFLADAEAAYARDEALTARYHALNGGKWNHMMKQVHMNYVSWNDPVRQSPPTLMRTAGDTPEGRRDAPVVFVDAESDSAVVSIEASAFERQVPAGGLAWAAIPDLGQGEAGMVVLPQGRPATPVPDGPRLEYALDLPEAAKLSVRLRLSPTLDTNGRGGLRLGVSLDEGPVTELVSALEPTCCDPDTPGKQRWYAAVIDNRVELTADFGGVTAGNHVIKVWRIDDNVVLEAVDIVLN